MDFFLPEKRKDNANTVLAFLRHELNEFIKINNNYNNRDLVLKFPYVSQILKGIFFSELILWYNLTGMRNICIAALATFISF